jgi:hypothetical protein
MTIEPLLNSNNAADIPRPPGQYEACYPDPFHRGPASAVS